MNLGSLLNRMWSQPNTPDVSKSVLEASRPSSRQVEKDVTASKPFERLLNQRVEAQEKASPKKVEEKLEEKLESSIPPQEISKDIVKTTSEDLENKPSLETKEPTTVSSEGVKALPEEFLALGVLTPLLNTTVVEHVEADVEALPLAEENVLDVATTLVPLNETTENLSEAGTESLSQVDVPEALKTFPEELKPVSEASTQAVQNLSNEKGLAEIIEEASTTNDLDLNLDLNLDLSAKLPVNHPLETALKAEILEGESLVSEENLVPETTDALTTELANTDSDKPESSSDNASPEQSSQSDGLANSTTSEEAVSPALSLVNGVNTPVVNPLGESNQPKALNLTPLASQAVQGIQSAYDSANKTMQLQLNPEDLGSLRIQIKQMNEGLISARLVVEQPDALNKMQDQVNDMQRHLESQGLKVDKIEVVLAGANSQASKDSAEGERPSHFQQSMNGDSDFKQSSSEESPRPQEDLTFTANTASETPPSTEQVQERLNELNALRQRYTQAENKTGISNTFTRPAPAIKLTQGVNILA